MVKKTRFFNVLSLCSRRKANAAVRPRKETLKVERIVLRQLAIELPCGPAIPLFTCPGHGISVSERQL